MNDGIRETPCTHCVHQSVCKHKDNFLKAIQAVNEATVHEHKVINYDCVSDISVTCRYYQPEATKPREGFF